MNLFKYIALSHVDIMILSLFFKEPDGLGEEAPPKSLSFCNHCSYYTYLLYIFLNLYSKHITSALLSMSLYVSCPFSTCWQL